ncbi:MAG: DUF2059 domain-containing protein [Opitutaceae bacterium]|nr:DUF2059 domain-containing protein [Opitutaceae bacterium]
MKKLGILLLSASCFAGSALAQNNGAPAAVPAPAAPSATPAQVALARDVVKAMGADRQIEGMNNQLKQMATSQSAMLAPTGATEEQKAAAAKVQGSIQDLAAEATKNMTLALDTAFAEVFTTEELAAIKAFFTSPEGQSFKAKQQQLSMRLSPKMQQLNEELRQKIGAIMQQAQPVAVAPSTAAPITATTPPVSVTTEPVSAPVPAAAPAAKK